MARNGWARLLDEAAKRPEPAEMAAYSEFMPAPLLGRLPYGAIGETPFDEGDPWGWRVTEHEELEELRPGMQAIAAQLMAAFVKLVRGQSSHGFARSNLEDNSYWPPELSERAGLLTHERFVCLMPLALSRTKDDKGRIRWTLFGGSEQGPARPFWRSFFEAPDRERPAVEALDFLRRLLRGAYGATGADLDTLLQSGLRILPQGELPSSMPQWDEGPLPSWAKALIFDRGRSLRGISHLLTFRPFAKLPPAVRRAYLAGKLNLLPCPASLIPWGFGLYHNLRAELPLATQIPLLNMVARHEGAHGIRVPQSGWFHEPRQGTPKPPAEHGPLRDTYQKTHRAQRTARDELAEPKESSREAKMAHVLFGRTEADMGLYDKPMARNVQLWTHEPRLLLNGPLAGRDEIDGAHLKIDEGGMFGYRFQFPAMRVGVHEFYWHRPLVAYLPKGGGAPTVLRDAPLGYLTAYRAEAPDPAAAVELWPRLLNREPYLAALELFRRPNDPRPHQVSQGCRNLLAAGDCLAEPLARSFAKRLIPVRESSSLDGWLDALLSHGSDPERVRRLAEHLRLGVKAVDLDLGASLTFDRTARREFEVRFWKTIASLAGGRYPNRNTADCARDPATRAALRHDSRDLHSLGDDILRRHVRSIASAGMDGRALAGDLPFRWRTECDLDWSDGWRESQHGKPRERDLMVVIPGRDRRRAIIMADHYDTAYMEDRYKIDGARLAAPGADDNTSATAALLMAAPVFLQMSRAGRLGCDIWLVHLTGEEFPADSMGARHLASRLVAGDLAMRLANGHAHSVRQTRVEGLFVLDMVAHENARRPGVFQISPGMGSAAMRLALETHLANEAWNRRVSRRVGHPRACGDSLPPLAPHRKMIGEVRPHDDPRSTLYNADSQIFSDAGIPTILLMEDYDIDRKGYHDSHDVMAGIDLPYGAALVAIAIEAVARAAQASFGKNP